MTNIASNPQKPRISFDLRLMADTLLSKKPIAVIAIRMPEHHGCHQP
jgi:hypothetical protein